MVVAVDQARHQHPVGEVRVRGIRMQLQQFLANPDADDGVAVNRHARICEDAARGIHRNEDVGGEEVHAHGFRSGAATDGDARCPRRYRRFMSARFRRGVPRAGCRRDQDFCGAAACRKLDDGDVSERPKVQLSKSCVG